MRERLRQAALPFGAHTADIGDEGEGDAEGETSEAITSDADVVVVDGEATRPKATSDQRCAIASSAAAAKA